MPQTVEEPERLRRKDLGEAPPIEASAAVEAARGIRYVRDTISKALILKSNAAVGAELQESLKGSLKLSKTVFGSVGKLFSTFSALRRIVGGV